jgi:phosphatidylglycerol---prolipoprotein diacylglyceryl transferase
MPAHAIGRLGCFLAGCCCGIPTDSWFGVAFPELAYRVHPTQLYESTPLFMGFIAVWIFRRKLIVPGTIYAGYLLLYGSIRFIVEFYRQDAYTFGMLNCSPSQYISLAVICAGAWLMRYSFIRYHAVKSYSDK